MSEKTAQAKSSVQADVRSENEAGAAQPEKFDLRSHTISEEKRRELLRLFPEVRTEGEKVDFNRLKLALGESVETGKERYGLTWPGKADCFKAIQTPSLGTLLPVPEESVKWDTTENLIIEGDNLEVLKLLQKSYLGKVKMIYIDPPYNTGNDFIYPDNYAESLQTYLEYTGQVDSQGKKFSTNSDTEGRFHSKWLNMMYPRLYLARDLLRSDGAIFVSIDDHEVSDLRLLMNEIFGEENYLGCIVWQKKYGPANDATGISATHEYILCYAKLAENWSPNLFPRSRDQIDDYDNPDNDPRGKWRASDLSARTASEACIYPIVTPSGRVVYPPKSRSWIVNKKRYEELLADNRIWFGVSGTGRPMQKKFLNEVRGGITPETWWPREVAGDNKIARYEIKDLFPENVFDTPKPTKLVKRLICMATNDGDIILDFFAGSGTTGDAVLRVNEEGGKRRHFILVQLPERTLEGSEADRAGHKTISDICKERIRQVIEKVKTSTSKEPKLTSWLDLGVRVYKLAESNFKVWDSAHPQGISHLQRRLTDHVHHIREGRSDQAILTELLLKSGFPPTIGISEVSVGGKKAFKVADGRLVVCLERHLTLEAIRAIADLRPERVVCLDEGFEGNDQLKVNAAQTFRAKGVASFQTV